MHDKDRSLLEELCSTCPIRNILPRISDKWSLVVIYTLEHSETPMRFKAIMRKNPDISQKMLTVTLRSLEIDGLVHREIYTEVPPRVEYSLTERAQTLLPHVNGLIQWANEHMSEIMEDRKNKSI